MSQYLLSGSASRDIEEILDYIAAQSVQTAVIVATRFDKAFSRIASNPGIGHARDELKDLNARVYAVSGYLVIYDPAPVPIHILRVVRGARDLSSVRSRQE